MMKFFRKYNKTLLVVSMVFLMIVFMGGNALYDLASPDVDRLIATSKLGKITLKQQASARSTTDILGGMGLPWQYPAMGARKPIEIMDWILLEREAKRLGMKVRMAAIQSSLGDNKNLNLLASRIGVPPALIIQAMAQYQTIQMLASQIGNAAIPSEAEVMVSASQSLAKVRFNAVMLPAAAFVSEDASFTEQQQQTHFDKYQNREAGTGLAFGYYVPPAIRVQYVQIDRNALKDLIRVPNLERRAKSFFDKRPEQPAFLRKQEHKYEHEEDENFVGPPISGKPYLTWNEAKDIAIGIIRQQEADEVAYRMADWIARTDGAMWLGVKRETTNYRIAPENLTAFDYYMNVIAKLPKNNAYPEVISIESTDFFTETKLDTIGGLGNAWYSGQGGGAGLNFRSMAFRSQPILADLSIQKDINYSDYLSLYETCRYPISYQDGDNSYVYVFRVVEGREGHIPETLDEVRDEVITDLRLVKGFEDARWQAVSLRNCEEDDMTLKESFESNVDLNSMVGSLKGVGLGYFEPPAVSRLSRFQAASLQNPDYTFVGSGVGQLPRAVIEQCFQLNDIQGRYDAIEIENRAMIMVVEWVETLPARDDDFLDMRASFVEQITRARTQAVVAEFLDPDNIRARNSFELVTNQ